MKSISGGRGRVNVRAAREGDLHRVVELKHQRDKHHELPGLRVVSCQRSYLCVRKLCSNSLESRSIVSAHDTMRTRPDNAIAAHIVKAFLPFGLKRVVE